MRLLKELQLRKWEPQVLPIFEDQILHVTAKQESRKFIDGYCEGANLSVEFKHNADL
jgi:hypothetical protein